MKNFYNSVLKSRLSKRRSKRTFINKESTLTKHIHYFLSVKIEEKVNNLLTSLFPTLFFSEAAMRASEAAGRASDEAGSALQPAERTSKPAGGGERKQ